MVVPCERLRVIRHQEFRPIADVVVVSRVERVALERERMLQVGKLLIGKSRRFAQWTRREFPAHGGVLIGETALEGHHHMAAILHVVRDAFQQCIVRDVERGHDQQLVGGEVLGLGEDEVAADVEVVERAVELLHQREVAVGLAGPASRRHAPAVGHEADGVG